MCLVSRLKTKTRIYSILEASQKRRYGTLFFIFRAKFILGLGKLDALLRLFDSWVDESGWSKLDKNRIKPVTPLKYMEGTKLAASLL